MNLVTLKSISKVYKSNFSRIEKVALDEINLSIDTGEFTGIMGPSGAGKTTLLNLIATIDSPSSGSITIKGKSIDTLKGRQLSEFRKHNLGFVFQDHNLLDTLTLRENILLPLALQRCGKQTADQRVQYLADLLGIEDILDKYPVENSGGQRQRAALARALAGSPELLLADEPTGSLDSKNARRLMETFSHLNKTGEANILLVTHDPFVASYCDRIIFIRDGNIFNEIRNPGNRKQFYKDIVNVLAILEGADDERN